MEGVQRKARGFDERVKSTVSTFTLTHVTT